MINLVYNVLGDTMLFQNQVLVVSQLGVLPALNKIDYA